MSRQQNVIKITRFTWKTFRNKKYSYWNKENELLISRLELTEEEKYKAGR